jgi:hypothetical protein
LIRPAREPTRTRDVHPVKTSRAYLASLGTTGLLVASSILLLAVVGAIVGFTGWPGGGFLTEIEGLVVDDKPSQEFTGPAGVARDAASAAAAVAASPAPGTPAAAAVLGTEPGGGGAGPAGPAVPGGGGTSPGAPGSPPGGGGGFAAPPGDGSSGGPDLFGLTGGLGEATGGISESVRPVSPDLGRTADDTGVAVSDILSGLGGSP